MVSQSSYLRWSQAEYLGNHWSLTKFCAAQFRGTRVGVSKADMIALKQALAKAKGYHDLDAIVGIWDGEQEFDAIKDAIESRDGRRPVFRAAASEAKVITDEASGLQTPPNRKGLDLSLLLAPLAPANELRMPIPALVSGIDEVTPTPTPAIGATTGMLAALN